MAETVTGIHYLRGSENMVADMLSRSLTTEVNAICAPGLDLIRLQQEQALYEETQRVLRDNPRYRRVPVDGVPLVCDVAPRPRIFIPGPMRRPLMEQVHGLSHASIKATRRLMAASFTWPGMSLEVATFVRACHRCQVSKVTWHHHATLRHFPLPNVRFGHVHADFVGPMTASVYGHRYLATFTDRYTRYVVAVPVDGCSADVLEQAFLLHWVAHFGVPTDLTCDRGPAFTAASWMDLCRQLGIRVRSTTAYHPQANGLLERAHRHLKESLVARGGDWEKALPYVLLGIRTGIKEDLQYAPAELVYAGMPALPHSLQEDAGNQ